MTPFPDTQGRYFHTFGVLGDKIRTKTGALKGTPENQQVRKDEWDGNSGSPPDECNSCYTTPAQREALVRRLEYWALWEHFPCPSCGSNYRTWFQSDSDLFDGYNSNTFTFNMLMQNPVGPIIPPRVSRAPGYHTADGEWYPTLRFGYSLRKKPRRGVR